MRQSFPQNFSVFITGQVTFTTVNKLKVTAGILYRILTKRKCLYHAMICNGQRFMTKSDRSLNQVCHWRDSIQLAHFCVAMQFHPFDRGIIFSLPDFYLLNGNRCKRHGLMIILIRFCISQQLQLCAGFQLFFKLVPFLTVIKENFYIDAAVCIDNIK